jgi:hypothetical protein
VSDSDGSANIARTQFYRGDITDGHVRDGKNTYRWERAICASSQDWAGWASCLAEGRNCRSATEVADDQSAQHRRDIGTPESAKHLHSTLVRGRRGAVDKLGMMRCVVCQAGPFKFWHFHPRPDRTRIAVEH